MCPAFFCQRDAGESEKEIWNRWKKILSITFPQTLPTYSLHMCAKVFRYAQYFLHKKWVCKVGIFGVLCLNQTCSVHTKIAIFVKMASARPPRVRFDMYCCKYLFLCLHCTCFATMPRAVVCMGCYVWEDCCFRRFLICCHFLPFTPETGYANSLYIIFSFFVEHF